MGITGLLPFLEKATKPTHISEFRGATVVVDTYCWLHKGATACAIQLIQGEETNVYVNYCLKFVKMLQSFDIRPILVFDGKNLPAKAVTEAKRRESRNRAKQKAAELMKAGKTQEARSYLHASVNITCEMASALIKECHKLKIDCIVAPYEADAQLAFFNLKGIAEFVITEDSDLVLFGCSKVLYKLDLQGCGYLVDAEKIVSAMKIRPDKYSFDKFRHMCILSGCDYAESLQGIGLKKAEKFITLTDETNPEVFLDKIPRYLKMFHLEITEEYKTNFILAEATFKHQIVFDPFSKKLIPLHDPEVLGTNPKYCTNAGQIYDHSKAYQVALGNLHPSSFKRLNNWDPKQEDLTNKSIWYDGIYQKSVSRKKQKQQSTFKDYFTQNKEQSKGISEQEENQLRQEQDDRIRKELEFYYKPKEKLETNHVNPSEVLNDVKVTSPVINSNPFIKKISKFRRTQVDSSCVVKSRFFCSELVEIPKISMDQEVTEMIINESDPDVALNEPELSPVITNGNDILISSSEFSELDILEHMAKENLPNDPHVCQNQQIVSNEALNVKRKILGPCRSVGLKRVKSHGQKTISSFFEKIEKQ